MDKILIFMVCIGKNWQNSGRLAIDINRSYAKKHGYDFTVVESSMDPSKTPHWTKILAMKQFILSGQYKSIFYIDADAIFTDFSQKIEYIPNVKDLPITIVNENMPNHLHMPRGENTGTMLLKSSQESIEFLDYAWSLYPECMHSCVYEQEALGKALERKYSNLWNSITCRSMNSYHGKFAESLHKPWTLWKPGDFVMHMLRSSEQDRMNEFIKFKHLV